MSKEPIGETHRSLKRFGVAFRSDDPEARRAAKSETAALRRADVLSELPPASQSAAFGSDATDKDIQSESPVQRKNVDPPSVHREWNYEGGLRAGPTALVLSVVALSLWCIVIVGQGGMLAMPLVWLSLACFLIAVICAVIAIVRRRSAGSGLLALLVCSVQIAIIIGVVMSHR
jgi:hypothetical protein